MPKIEKDLLKVKGSDGQWRYVPAVGGSADTAPTWDSVQNKPFSTLGSGLEVDENGVLSVDTTDNAEQGNTKPITSAGLTSSCEILTHYLRLFNGGF